ncbi:MAG: DinB family protein [Ignavibacteria bacterium]|nr:DinB family protein [Ignavibacteria bacterium]
MSQKKYLLDQLKTTFNEKGWLVSFTDSLTGLDAKDAASPLSAGGHSIWGIVDHLIFWNSRWLLRFKGAEPDKITIDNSRTFDVASVTEENWKSTVKKLSDIMEEVIKLVEASSDEFLSKEAFKGYGASWYEMFSQYTLHNAYHTGQIVQLRKIQGSWNAEYGIKA